MTRRWLPKRDHSPEGMTSRARWYLIIGALRHALIGIFAIGWADQWKAVAFVPILSYAPLWVWGTAMLLIAAVMGVAHRYRDPSWARMGLIASATLTLALGTGIGLGVAEAWATGQTATPVTAILLLALAFKDYAVCTQPMRSPFEPLLRRMPNAPTTVAPPL